MIVNGVIISWMCYDKRGTRGWGLTSLEKQGIAVLYTETLQEFYDEWLYDEDFDQLSLKDEKSVSLFINAEKNGIPTIIDKKTLFETESFATLLNNELLNVGNMLTIWTI